MPGRFYDTTSMGENFDDNPVLAVQRRQLSSVVGIDRMRDLRVLDLGCGAGTTSLHLVPKRRDVSVIGADISPSALRAYTRATANPAVRVDAEVLPFADDSFDIVITDDVVEHLPDTDSFARELRRVLRPTGWLLLSTPNLAAWFNRLGLLAGLQPAFSEVSYEKVFGRPGSEIVGHLRIFTWRSTVQFLEYHGFEVIDVQGARFHAMTGAAGTVDRAMRHIPALAGNTAVVARTRP